MRPMLIGAAVLCVLLGWLGARAHLLDTLAANIDITQPGAKAVVDWLASGSSDPEAHLRAAVYYERTFEAQDLDRALAEYRKAAELSPNNYVLWMNLALALSRSGDAEGAEAAFRRAQELAPNYADVQWAYGNFLVRQGREGEGFPLIARAAAVDPKVAVPAVTITLQVSDGDAERVRSVLGGSPPIELALATTLAASKNYPGSLAAWQRIPLEIRSGAYRPDGEQLINVFLGVGQYRAAAAVVSDLAVDESAKPVVGQVNNAGFESGVKLRKAGPFEWQIADGPEPQIGLSESTAHGGRYGLSIGFNTFRPEGFRDISQVVAVEPGGSYRLEVWYKSSLKTSAKFKWQVVTAKNGALLAATPEMTPEGEWTRVAVSFVVPQDADGIRLQLAREACGGAACPVNGSLSFDDVTITHE
jgi:tetratricopeptide (TPR) repeat protein